MKKHSKLLPRVNLSSLLVVGLCLLVADPLGVQRGNFSQDSYSQIRSALARYDNPKVLRLGSWNDFYSLEYNNYWRQEISQDFVERNYGEVLNAASLGNDFFNGYLQANDFSHVLIPRSTFDRGVIRHKFTNRGSIEIELGSPFFNMVATSSGPYEAVLLEVNKTTSQPTELSEALYDIKWKNTDWWFFTKQTRIAEIGLYRLSYTPFYEWGPDVSWYFDLSPERPNNLELEFNSYTKLLNEVHVELTLVAAYGQNAPPHTVSVSTGTYSETKTLSPNSPGVFKLEMESGESLNISNLTPCRLPRTFEPSDLSEFKMCFGVSKILISPRYQGG